jgi:hypothetical protein
MGKKNLSGAPMPTVINRQQPKTYWMYPKQTCTKRLQTRPMHFDQPGLHFEQPMNQSTNKLVTPSITRPMKQSTNESMAIQQYVHQTTNQSMKQNRPTARSIQHWTTGRTSYQGIVGA